MVDRNSILIWFDSDRVMVEENRIPLFLITFQDAAQRAFVRLLRG